MSRKRWGDPLAKNSGRRQARVNDLLRREMGMIIQRYYPEELHLLTTVTEVRTTGDLRHARIFVSVLADKAQQTITVNHLQNKRQELRRHLAERIILKYIPTLEFIIDDSEEKARHIEDLLKRDEPQG